SADIGDAVCSVNIQGRHENAGGAVQGGVIFTLADFAFAVAANCGGGLVVSLSSSISFIGQPHGASIAAHAKLRAETSRICFYDVDVTDSAGTLIARVDVTGYKKNRGMAKKNS
ncbi:MAG: PaaI family thioesterase, partial [Clostridia bacterium]